MNFTKALNNLLGYEKGYADIKGDSGGETYGGIARNYHPTWEGWGIIDSYKKEGVNLNKTDLLAENELNKLVEKFYKVEYWDKFLGDQLPENVASELLEESVNLGTWKTAGKNLQRALNFLNRNGKLFDDLEVDGFIGSVTLYAVGKVNSARLVRVLNGLQFEHYAKLMRNNPEQYEKFVGWFDRI